MECFLKRPTVDLIYLGNKYTFQFHVNPFHIVHPTSTFQIPSMYILKLSLHFSHIHTNYRLHKIYTSFRYFEKIEFSSLNLSRLIYQCVLFLNIVDKKHNHVSHIFQLNQFNIITIQNVFSCFQICRTLETKIYLIQGADISNSRRRLMCLKDREIECYFSLSS